MNPKAYEILAQMEVSIPKEYCVDEIYSSQGGNKYFFCRFSEDSELSSRLYKDDEIISNIHNFNNLQHKKKLIKIEEVVDCICGCVIYVTNGNIYGEFVDGHIMSLLRKGVCSKRFLINLNESVYFINQFQRWIVQRVDNEFIYIPNKNFSESRMKLIQDLILYLITINFKEENSLFEIMVSKNKYVFCDAKILPKDDFFVNANQIFIKEKKNIVIKAPIKKDNPTLINQIDCFDVDYEEINNNLSNNNITVYNDAILSHFVTRNYKYFNSINFQRRDNKIQVSKIDRICQINESENELKRITGQNYLIQA
jgi:hypothetical protein